MALATHITILDGGMGRELLRSGAPFRQPEWSALALIEAPEHVRRVHESFINAGAQVITTNSYAVVPFHIGEQRFRERGLELVRLAGTLAREAAQTADRPVRVAGSLPPLFGSYRPDLFNPDEAPALLSVLIEGLSPHVDFWLAETQSGTAEVRAVREALGNDERPLWLSFTLDDTGDAEAVAAGREPPRLRSGETVTEAAAAAVEVGASALLFNCSQAEIMEAAVKAAVTALRAADSQITVGVYANAFVPEPDPALKRPANAGLSALREDLDASGYLHFARRWVDAGATIIGGCCGIGPEHIAELASTFKSHPEAA